MALASRLDAGANSVVSPVYCGMATAGHSERVTTSGLRLHAVSIEEYEGSPHVVRLVGTNGLLEAFLSLPAGAVQVYFVQKHDCPCVRFCYEFLFLPKTGSWVFSREHLVQHLWGTP